MDKNHHETKKTEELPTYPRQPPSLQLSGKPLKPLKTEELHDLPTFPLTFSNIQPILGNFGSNGDLHPLQKNDGMLFGPGNNTFDNLVNTHIINKAIRDKYPYGPPGFSTFNGEPNPD